MQVTHPALQVQGDYLYLLKGQVDTIGDERIRYSGVPVPATATYFGKAESGPGVGDTSQARAGMINALIQDSGVLHHIVASAPQTGSNGEEQLKNLIRLALADGDLSRSELNLIQHAAEPLGLDNGVWSS